MRESAQPTHTSTSPILGQVSMNVEYLMCNVLLFIYLQNRDNHYNEQKL